MCVSCDCKCVLCMLMCVCECVHFMCVLVYVFVCVCVCVCVQGFVCTIIPLSLYCQLISASNRKLILIDNRELELERR